MIRQIKKETLKEAIRLYLKYWKTGDRDILNTKNRVCEDLSKQVFKTNIEWGSFANIIGGLTYLKHHRLPNITYETIYKVFETLGFEIVDKEIYVQESLEIKEV